MRKLILFLLVFVSVKVSAQVYQEMPQYGYRANRMAFDSTLQIPTVCGVPTLKSVVKTNKNGAIAYDSCNAIFYTYNPKTQTWSAVTGGGGGSTDTTSLSNRINLKIDSLKRSNDSVYAYKNGVRFFQYKDSVGSGGGDFWKTSGTTNLTGTVTIGNNGIINFFGVDEDLQKFNVNALDVQFDGGLYKFTSMTAITDTSTYKPLGINASGQIAPLTSWVSGGGASDTIYTQSPIMYITRNDSNIIYFNEDTANVWRSTGTASDTSKVVIAQVHNATATTLLKGEVVYFFGSTGNVASVKRANNKDDSTSSKTFGVVRSDILAGANGFITTQGQVEKLTLGAYNEGDVLWLDSIDGQFTKVKPQAPYHAVFIGIVERANNGNGLAYVKPQNGVELEEVHDVQINNVLNNQIIVYSDTQKVWKNRNITSLIDTTLFQRKSIQPYSFLANNTSGTANAQALPFKDTSGVYTLSPVWGTSAPTGATNHTYRWTRIGNMVTLNISLVYGTVSSNNTTLTIPLPTDCPTPVKPTGLTAASNFLYPAYCNGGNTLNTAGNLSARGGIRSNSGNNGFEFNFTFTANPFIFFQTTVTYYTN